MIERRSRIRDSVQDAVSNAIISGEPATIGSIANVMAIISGVIDEELDAIVEQFNNELENIKMNND